MANNLWTSSTLIALVLFLNGFKQYVASCQDPVTCYLETVVIGIPDFCQDVNGKDLCINGFACHGINIGGLPSAYIAPTTLEAGITGVGTSCAGDYSYGRLVSGTMTASISDTNLGVDLFVGKSGEFPVSTEFSKCNISSMNVDITFSSGGLDDLAPALEMVIKKAVNALVCVKIADFVAVNVTNALVNTVDPALAAIIASEPTPLPQQYDSAHYMTWSDSIVSKIHKLVDMIDGLSSGGEFLQCLVSDAPTLVHDLLERETRKLLTAGESKHRIAVDLRDRNLVAPVPSIMSGLLGSKTASAGMASLLLSAAPPMNSTVQVTGIALYGFDTMNTFALLDPMTESNVSLHTQIGFDSLAVEIDLEFTVVSINDVGETITYVEALQAAFRTHDAYVLADVVLAVNEFLLKSYYMDQLSSVNCWLSALTEFSIANLQLHLAIDELSITQISGSAGPFEADVIALIDNALQLVTSGFGPLVTDTINGIMQGPVRNGVNTKVAESLAAAKHDMPCLSHYPYYDSTDYIKWTQSSLITMLDKIVNEQVGYDGINKIMNCATNYTGAIALNTSHLHIQVAGLNSFYALKVLAPTENTDYDLTNELGLGYCPTGSSSADCNPLRVIIASYEDIESENSVFAMTVNEIARQFKIVLSLENLDVFLDLLLKIDKNGVRDLTFGQTSTNGCTQSTMQSFAIEAMAITLSRAELSINDGATERNITTIVSKILDTITRAEKVAARNANMQYQLSVAEETCRMGGVAPDSMPDDTTEKVVSKNNEWKWELLVLSLACITCLICLLWAYQYWGQAKQLNCMLGAEDLDAEGQERASTQAVDRRSLWDKWDCSNALVFHSKVPTWLQIAVPIVIIGNMGMFLDSNMLPDAVSVMTEIDIGSDVSITPDSVFDFGLASTVGDMWDAKVYPLSILIAFFSGAWPYVKLASMLATWVTPPGLMGIERREYILTWLDVLGKWSLIDFFVMVLMLCAFYFNLYIGNNMVVKVTVLPKWGFYSFLLATMISLGLGHIILACHRLVVEHKLLPLPEAYSPKESLASMTYTVYLEPEDKKTSTSPASTNSNAQITAEEGNDSTARSALLPASASSHSPATDHVTSGKSREAIFVRLTNLGTCAVVLMICATAFFVLAGTFLDTMTFEFKGMVGWMLHDKSQVDYSFVSVGTSLPEHSGIPNDFAIRWLQGSFFLFGMAMPLALCVALTILWVVPLSISMQRQLFVLAEVLNAWSTLDVYSVSIIAALLEIQQFAMFIVGDSCDGINKLLENFDEALDGDDKCFDVVAVLKNSCWTIFLAAVLLIVVGLPSLSICHKAIHTRMEQTEQGLFDHIQRRQSLSETLKEQEEDLKSAGGNRSNSKDKQLQQQAANEELTKPLLLVDVPLNEHAMAAAVTEPQSSAQTPAAAPVAAKKSMWSQLTMHNLNILLLRAFARMQLVTIDVVDPSLLAKQQLREARAQQAEYDMRANADFLDAKAAGKEGHVASTPATPQHNISYTDIYGNLTPNKAGNNEMNVHVTPF